MDPQPPEEPQRLAADAGAAYDAQMAEAGYAGPGRAAAALAGLHPDLAAPLIELGCGTGLVGEALRAAGFTTIDGIDPSEAMLARARAKPGLYRTLLRAGLDAPLPVGPGTYINAAAIGILAPGHAPPTLIDAGLRLLPRGGLFVLSLSDLATGTPGYLGRIRENVDAGAAEIAFREYGRFLPSAQLCADIFVLRRR